MSTPQNTASSFINVSRWHMPPAEKSCGSWVGMPSSRMMLATKLSALDCQRGEPEVHEPGVAEVCSTRSSKCGASPAAPGTSPSGRWEHAPETGSVHSLRRTDQGAAPRYLPGPTDFGAQARKARVIEEMRSLAGTKKKAQKAFPHLYQRHESLCKELSQLRKTLAKDTKETARKEHFYNAPILEVDRQIKRLLSQADPEDCNVNSPDKKDWELPIPTYIFPERERLVDNFYGPDAESYEDDKLLARRIQATKDMVALSTLCEPNRRGDRVNWKFDDDESAELEKPCFLEEETLDCPTDRQDSLRRHLIDCHLAKAYDRIRCTWKMCHDVPKFTKIADFLAHAIYVHAYDVNIQLKHLPPRQPVSGREDSSSDDSDSSSDSNRHSGIDTPASSITSEITNTDPRLIESGSVHSTQCLVRRSKRIKVSV
ncbi:hypothetical protein TSTA_125030 [Talaromyces stipitatus ATCC 10500]|uniref:Uncharacterized protein n=1 Tax=Talaromyces stipitatus (strain ATCC 10500 / CBS 375.48 / QM 6759 / NRRL 1006) TaxID=441959 RepID=B8MCG9_TALSN|nr:uncharacterized protein TSTA_125030 [Talaromyces stipitatus ATCC 10500]EED18785.1 hypothetical protein TSTA_125030 [Talaromyces stipitatus ATCC 10500]